MASDRAYDPNDPSTWQLDPSEPDPSASRQALLNGFAPTAGGSLYDTTTGQTRDLSQNPSDPSLQLPGGIQTATGGDDTRGEDGGTTAPGPPSSAGSPFTPGAGFTNTSTVPSAKPNGIADPANPGYDTAGFRMGASVDASGNLTIPNTATGQQTTTQAGTMNRTTTPLSPPEPPPRAPVYTPPPIGADSDTAAFNAKLRTFLLSQLGDLSTPTDENDPALAPSITAYRNQSARDEQAMRDAEAERFYAQGGGGGEGLASGAFGTALQQDREAAAGSRANFTGSLVYNASQAKRQQLQAMMQTAVSAGQTDAAQQIQAQIAAIDAGLRSQGLTNANTNFNDSLAERYAELKAQMNRDQLMAALGQ